ncbi:MAG TPA: hypothetical protein VKI00_29945 [Mycobacterium sp.]|uniref:hypothetical protein n=1 Tax=Mycobacterium sp. TaxID=1785 RepID=UPI002C2E6CDA|nr:hypothetical protein [Mycobacterium sp.]HME79735.1 hypothetical protein [Mycobacterium sp.]
MERLRVSDGLQAVATRCNALASEIAEGAPPAPGPSSQPSSAAMKIGHAGVRQATAAMATRMQATGTDIAFADISYNETEAHAALKLSAVATDA